MESPILLDLERKATATFAKHKPKNSHPLLDGPEKIQENVSKSIDESYHITGLLHDKQLISIQADPVDNNRFRFSLSFANDAICFIHHLRFEFSTTQSEEDDNISVMLFYHHKDKQTQPETVVIDLDNLVLSSSRNFDESNEFSPQDKDIDQIFIEKKKLDDIETNNDDDDENYDAYDNDDDDETDDKVKDEKMPSKEKVTSSDNFTHSNEEAKDLFFHHDNHVNDKEEEDDDDDDDDGFLVSEISSYRKTSRPTHSRRPDSTNPTKTQSRHSDLYMQSPVYAAKNSDSSLGGSSSVSYLIRSIGIAGYCRNFLPDGKNSLSLLNMVNYYEVKNFCPDVISELSVVAALSLMSHFRFVQALEMVEKATNLAIKSFKAEREGKSDDSCGLKLRKLYEELSKLQILKMEIQIQGNKRDLLSQTIILACEYYQRSKDDNRASVFPILNEVNMDETVETPFKFPGQYRKSIISKRSILIDLYGMCVKDSREYFQWIGIRGFAHVLEMCDCWIGHDIVPLTHSLLMEYDYLCFSMGEITASSNRSSNKLSSPESSHSSKYLHDQTPPLAQIYAERTFVQPQNQTRLLVEILEVLSEVFKLLPKLEASVISLLYTSLTDVLSEGLCKSQEVSFQVLRLISASSHHVQDSRVLAAQTGILQSILITITGHEDINSKASALRVWTAITDMILGSDDIAILMVYLEWCHMELKQSLKKIKDLAPSDPEDIWRYPSPSKTQSALSLLQLCSLSIDFIGRILFKSTMMISGTRVKISDARFAPFLESLFETAMMAFSLNELERSNGLKERLWSLVYVVLNVLENVSKDGSSAIKNLFFTFMKRVIEYLNDTSMSKTGYLILHRILSLIEVDDQTQDIIFENMSIFLQRLKHSACDEVFYVVIEVLNICYGKIDDCTLQVLLESLLDRYTMRSVGYEALHKHILAIILTKDDDDDKAKKFPLLSSVFEVCLFGNKAPSIELLEKDKKTFNNEYDLFVEKLAFLCHVSRLMKDYHVASLIMTEAQKSLFPRVLKKCQNLMQESFMEAKAEQLLYHIVKYMSKSYLSHFTNIKRKVPEEFLVPLLEFHLFVLDVGKSKLREETILSDNLYSFAKILRLREGFEMFISSPSSIWHLFESLLGKVLINIVTEKVRYLLLVFNGQILRNFKNIIDFNVDQFSGFCGFTSFLLNNCHQEHFLDLGITSSIAVKLLVLANDRFYHEQEGLYREIREKITSLQGKFLGKKGQLLVKFSELQEAVSEGGSGSLDDLVIQDILSLVESFDDVSGATMQETLIESTIPDPMIPATLDELQGIIISKGQADVSTAKVPIIIARVSLVVSGKGYRAKRIPDPELVDATFNCSYTLPSHGSLDDFFHASSSFEETSSAISNGTAYHYGTLGDFVRHAERTAVYKIYQECGLLYGNFSLLPPDDTHSHDMIGLEDDDDDDGESEEAENDDDIIIKGI